MPDTPELTTEVVGFRQWRVRDDLKLRAAHKQQAVWGTGVIKATCHPHANPFNEGRTKDPCKVSPGPCGECGLYALHSPDDFWYGKSGARGTLGGIVPSPDPLIAGIVVAWGEMEVHATGFRAQFARIVALATPESRRDAAVARAVAGEYGVPLVAADALPQIASEFGQTVPEELRPKRERTPITDVQISGTINSTMTMKEYRRLVDLFYGPRKGLNSADPGNTLADFLKRTPKRRYVESSYNHWQRTSGDWRRGAA